MSNEKARFIRRSRREEAILRELSKVLQRLAQDEPSLLNLFISRVELSKDSGHCTAFVHAPSEDEFNKKVEILKLYKPSIRKILGTTVKSKYVPELRFKFDSRLEKVMKVEKILDEVGQELSKGESTEEKERVVAEGSSVKAGTRSGSNQV